MEISMDKLLAGIGEAVKTGMAEAMKDAKPETKGEDVVKAPAVMRGAEPEEAKDKRSGLMKMAAMTRFLTMAKGDPERAAVMAEKHGDLYTKTTLTTIDFDSGGSLVPTDFAQDFFEALRPRSAVRSINPQIVPLVNGSMTLPGITSGATASYKGQAAAVNATSVSTGDIRLTEKHLIAIIPISNQMLRVNSGRAEQFIARDLINEMARAEDTNFISGDGTAGKPLGIRNQMLSAHSTAGTSSSVTLQKIDSDLAAMRKLVKAANVNISNGAYLLHTDEEEDLMKLRSGDVKAYPEMDSGRIGGYRYATSNNLSSGVIMFGNADDIILGESETLRISMSEDAAYLDASGTMRSAFSSDVTVMRVIAGHDIALRYQAAWAEKTAVDYATLT